MKKLNENLKAELNSKDLYDYKANILEIGKNIFDNVLDKSIQFKIIEYISRINKLELFCLDIDYVLSHHSDLRIKSFYSKEIR